MMAAENHRPDPILKLPVGKVLTSLSSAVPLGAIVIPKAAEVMEKSSRSAPSSPVKEEKRRKGLLKHLARPRSPSSPRMGAAIHSDPERSPSPNTAGGDAKSHRPKWLVFKSPRRRKSKDMNGSTTPGDNTSGSVEDLTRLLELEPSATPVEQLPGRTLMKTHSGSAIPVITVSHSGGENHMSASLEDLSGQQRKMSQSSHCSSNFCSAATSGVGSLLSPSGDECYIADYLGDDLESPISPLSSRTSSFTEQVPGDLSDLDQDLVSPSSDQETVISPSGSNSLISPMSEDPLPILEPRVRSPTEGKQKKKNQRSAWDNLKKAVKAWSPFAVQFKKKLYPWVQLAGHQGNFMPGEDSGTIMKKSDPNERKALEALMIDQLKPFVPEFKKVIEKDGHMYVEMTDLLREFEEPAVMDIKMGIRTYLEEELRKKDLRPDMYEKMIQVDPHEPTEAEHAQKAITKPRYMQWRESLSSSSTLGFRVEGIKTSAGKALKDFKETRAKEDVLKALRLFLEENPAVKGPFLKRLHDIKACLEGSEFFKSHELIGSSLLFVYDSTNLCSIHMIDFGKTVVLPGGVSVDHKTQWVQGNHEDGYLFGLNNLIQIWEQL